MNINYQLFIVIITIFSQFCAANKFNKTLSDYENGCNVGQIEHFFEVSSVNKNLKNNMERLHLKFYVMAERSALIMLSEVDNPRGLDENKNRGYLIVLGSESLKIKNSSYDIVHEKHSPNLFSKVKPTPVEIIITKDNEWIVNIPGYSEPFMKYSDTHSLKIKFFRFNQYLGYQKWFYNCTFDENSNVEDQKMSENEVKTVETKKTNVNQQQLCEDQKMPENEVKTVGSKNTNVNQQQLSQQPKSTANPTETRPFSKHNLFFDALVPMLDKFDDNKMLDFHIRVLEVIKELKNPPTTTTKKPVAIDVRIGNTEESSCSCS